WRRLLENSLSAKVSCWLIRLLILGSGYNTMISHLGLIRTFLNKRFFSSVPFGNVKGLRIRSLVLIIETPNFLKLRIRYRIDFLVRRYLPMS
ncbi:hypothetical protein, partial [Enterobacter cloacae complex sp. IR5422]|uniref:hypothetical protein n=1 Tax=Enterobacter cloacae complex sp. IR5422 TaxID=3412363 RepID=UPI003BA0D3C3